MSDELHINVVSLKMLPVTGCKFPVSEPYSPLTIYCLPPTVYYLNNFDEKENIQLA